MKKFFALILVLVMLFTTMAVPVHAVGSYVSTNKNTQNDLTYEELIRKAEYAFPEHTSSSVFIVQPNTIKTENKLGTILSSETRRLSETERITYTEYTSGYSLYTYQVDVLINSSSSGTGYSNANVDIYVYSRVLVGVLQVHNFSYSLVQSNYDIINSTGNLGQNCVLSYLGTYKLREDADGSAFARYTGVLENTILGTNITITLEVNVGNDSCTQEVYG